MLRYLFGHTLEIRLVGLLGDTLQLLISELVGQIEYGLRGTGVPTAFFGILALSGRVGSLED